MINNVVLVGRLTRDPELKYTPSNVAIVNLSRFRSYFEEVRISQTTLDILLKKSKHLVEIFLFMMEMKLKKLFLSISLIISDMKT